MSKPKIYVRDRIYVPKKSVPDVEALKNAYTMHLFKDAACAKCEYLKDRPCAVCESCPNYTETLTLWKSKMIGGLGYYGLPIGDKRRLERRTGVLYEDHTIVDKRIYVPLRHKIKFLIELRPHQKVLVEDFLRHKYGLLEAPPRTGKTVLMLYIGLKLGQRMLLLANQHEYLQQFLWHIEGNEEEGIPKCTNLPELQAKCGKKLYGFPKTAEDFSTMEFMVMTYQQFLSEKNGKNRLKLLEPNIGTVAVDECFTGEHRVMTEDGLVSMRDIVDGTIRPSRILSHNHETGEKEFKPLESVTRKTVRQLCRVTIDGKSFVCTPNHEFWSKTRGCYVEAQMLKPKEEICFSKSDLE